MLNRIPCVETALREWLCESHNIDMRLESVARADKCHGREYTRANPIMSRLSQDMR